MTDLITEARELCETATPGPWESRIDVGKKYYVFTPSYGVRDFCCLSGGFERESDAAFIARSRTLIPELCDALEKAQEQNKQLLHELCKLACESVEREKTLARLVVEVECVIREKQKRSGCDYCNLIYKLDGAAYGTTDEVIDNKFCPMCGRELEEYHEAD